MPKKMTVGSWVRLKKPVRKGPQKAQIVLEDDGFAEGAVLLSARLDDFRWWNKDDLVPTDPPKRWSGKLLPAASAFSVR